MKIKHFTRVFAVVLVLTMMPLWMFGCGKSGKSDITSTLAELMIGDGSLKKVGDDSAAKDYITALDNEVSEISDDFNGATWSASTLTGSNSKTTQHFENTYKMILAWSTKGSKHYHDGKILDKVQTSVKGATEILLDDFFNQPLDERFYSAEYLVRTLVILSDAGKIKDDLLDSCLEVIDLKYSAAFGDGYGYTRTFYVVIASAALKGDKDRLASAVSNYAKTAYKTVTTGDGIYADGSYLTTEIASTSSYGNIAFGNLTEIAYALAGSSADFDEETKKNVQGFLYNWAKTSVIPSLYNGSALAGTAGSYVSEADKLGGQAISSVLLLADYLNDERADELKSIIKGYCESNNDAFASGFTSYGACKYNAIEKNDKISAKKVTGAFSFSQMDKLSVLGNKYSASLALSSDRSVKYETRPIYNPDSLESLGAINGKGWYTGDGMLLLYTNDYQVSDKYWTYVNAQRIPGTTVDNSTRVPQNDGNFDGTTSYAGSAVLGNNAVSSYFMKNNNSASFSDLTAKKSYFFFDGKIVALGAGISSTYVDNLSENFAVETVVENIFYDKKTTLAITSENDLSMSANTIYEAPESMYASKFGGIYIPKASNSGKVNCRINSTNNGSLNFLEIWIDHGSTPLNATYEYAIVPSTVSNMDKFFEEFAAAPDYEVISNTDKVQAVKDTATGLIGYTFWEAAECNGIKVDFACNMMVKESDSTVTIALSDYTHGASENANGNTITLSGNYTLKNNPTGVTLNGNVLTIDRDIASNGSTITIELTK